MVSHVYSLAQVSSCVQSQSGTVHAEQITISATHHKICVRADAELMRACLLHRGYQFKAGFLDGIKREVITIYEILRDSASNLMYAVPDYQYR